MSNQQYEVEVKVLLGEKSAATEFLKKLKSEEELEQTAASNQLNHYFTNGGDPNALLGQLADILADNDLAALRRMVKEYETFSLRTREENGTVKLVIKAARKGEDDQHAVLRAGGEYPVSATIEELDQRILAAGYQYLSKWSRERTEFRYRDYTVCLDKNAGYGYLAEVEKVVGSEDEADTAKQEILTEVERLGYEELPQDRLGRMFDYYNAHWPEYYQTDKTFVVK